MKRLCDTCEYRVVVENRESGMVIDHCNGMPGDRLIPLRSLGDVVKCSKYEAKDLPYLFVRAAWLPRNLPDGSVRFMSEGDWGLFNERERNKPEVAPK